MKIVTYTEARELGFTTYFTGKPCKRGHVAERHVNGGCKECDRLKKKAWRAENPQESRRRVMEYQRKNKEKYNAKRLDTHAKKRRTDMQFNMLLRLRRRLNGALHAQGAVGVARTKELLGCTGEELKDYLAGLFLPGMSWDNYGEWEIDHIKPCKLFNLLDDAQQRECFHFTNLQPLWMSDNRSKGAKHEPA